MRSGMRSKGYMLENRR